MTLDPKLSFTPNRVCVSFVIPEFLLGKELCFCFLLVKLNKYGDKNQDTASQIWMFAPEKSMVAPMNP